MDVPAATEPIPAIRTRGLTKRYGRKPAVADLDLTVPAGEIVGFLGPNGAGKSTTIAMLLGLTRPTAGTIEVLGRDVARHRAQVQRRVGALLESPTYYDHLSVHDNLVVLARLGRFAESTVPDLVARVGLEAAARQRARGLSLGQRQRLGLAAALLGDPELLILDEPTNGLDPGGVHAVYDLLRGVKAAGGTVFFSSHRLEEVQALCTSVAILRGGRLVAQGRVADLLRSLPVGSIYLRADDPGRAQAVLTAAGLTGTLLTDSDGPLLCVQAPRERAAAVNALLNSQGVGVSELRAEAPGIEDLFLTLTGGTDG